MYEDVRNLLAATMKRQRRRVAMIGRREVTKKPPENSGLNVLETIQENRLTVHLLALRALAAAPPPPKVLMEIIGEERSLLFPAVLVPKIQPMLESVTAVRLTNGHVVMNAGEAAHWVATILGVADTLRFTLGLSSDPEADVE